MKRKRQYQRTAALLGAQPHVVRPRATRQRTLTLPRISWRIWLPLFVMLGFVGWLVFDSRWYVHEDNVQVIGTMSRSLATEVAVASDLLDWHGLLLRPQAADELVLETVAGVTSATAICDRFPVDCVIEVVEREPHFIWQTASDMYWVDQAGVLFEAQSERDDLPRITGALPNKDIAGGIPLDIVQGIDALVALDVPEGVILTSFAYHPRRGLIWSDSEGRRIAFGLGSEMALRWRVYQTLVAQLDEKGVFPASVDVRFPLGPTYALDRSW